MKPNKELIIFDLDGTLTASKSVLDDEMAELLVRLLEKKKVAVISGGKFQQFETQFLSKLPANSEQLANLLILPTSGAKLYVWQGTWREQYAQNLSMSDKKTIMEGLNSALSLVKYEFPKEPYGEVIEDRYSQITFSALGQHAPLQLKKVWDPDKEKRQAIVEILKKKIPEFDIGIGGETSIDITMKGVDKAYGIHKLAEFLNMSTDRMVFVGDTIFPGGNDYPAKEAGLDCVSIGDPEDTKKVILEWLND